MDFEHEEWGRHRGLGEGEVGIERDWRGSASLVDLGHMRWVTDGMDRTNRCSRAVVVARRGVVEVICDLGHMGRMVCMTELRRVLEGKDTPEDAGQVGLGYHLEAAEGTYYRCMGCTGSSLSIRRVK